MTPFRKLSNFYPWIMSVLIGLLTISWAMDRKMDEDLPDDDKQVYSFMNIEGQKMEQKYHMNLVGIGVGGMDEVGLMSLAFHRNGEPLNESGARKLAVNCIQDFLASINASEELRPLLKQFPFKPENVDIGIINYDQAGFDRFFPHIGTISCSSGKIGYLTDEPDNYRYKTKKYETFEEALEILQKESDRPAG